MNNNKITLNIHLIPGNKGSLVFYKEGKGGGSASLRMNRLCGALDFVGSMKQLQMAIETGAEQHCFYPMRNDTGREWFLYCRASGGQISIAVCSVPEGNPVFEWEGEVQSFRNAVNRMIANMGRYQ